NLGIEMASLKVIFGEEEFIDKVTITNDEFYEKLKSSRHQPKTTLVTPDKFIEIFNKYPKDSIVGIFLSSKLSGTFQSAQIAMSDLEREDIYLVDSGSASLGIGLLIEKAVQMRDDGVDAAEIYKNISELKEKLRIIAAVDTLEYLVKGGRLPASKGMLGSILNLKPLLIVQDGDIKPLGKARGMKNALKELLKIYYKSTPNKDMPIAFAHSGNADYLNSIREEFEAQDSDKTFVIGSVVGAHSGPGAVAVAYFVN
ncbi:MAG: DegV family protein, partial [Oscillospiraceae bacterium]